MDPAKENEEQKQPESRTSKGRQVKCVPIPKLANFHPAMPESVEWSNERRNELFKSVFQYWVQLNKLLKTLCGNSPLAILRVKRVNNFASNNNLHFIFNEVLEEAILNSHFLHETSWSILHRTSFELSRKLVIPNNANERASPERRQFIICVGTSPIIDLTCQEFSPFLRNMILFSRLTGLIISR
jgi:hypothetical protein